MSNGSGDEGSNEVADRVKAVAGQVESRLSDSLTNGQIDMEKLQDHDAALFKVLEAYALSKSDRTDPKVTASDVGKLLEAQSRTTPLGAALEQLKQSLDD